MTPKIDYPLVEVIWEDIAEHTGGWMDKVEKIEPVLVRSIGFLVADTPEHVVLAMDVAIDGTSNQRAQIPKGVIKKIKPLRKSKQKPKTDNNDKVDSSDRLK